MEKVRVSYRPLLLCALGLCAGIFCAAMHGTWVIVAGLSGAISLIWAIAYRKKGFIILSLSFLFGILRILSLFPDFMALSADTVAVRGEVYSVSDDQTVLSNVYAKSKKLNGKLIISDAGFKVGDRITFSAVVKTNSGSFNEKQLLSRGILYSADISSPITKTGEAHNLHTGICKIREHIHNLICDTFGDNAQTVCAVVLNEKAGEAGTLSAYRGAGLSHILALSGLHVSLFAFVIHSMLFFLHKKTRYAVTFIILLFYAHIVGFPPSFARALIFLAMRYIAVISCRHYDPLSTLSLAACIILIVNPYILYSAGFILSFIAVLSIILMYKPVMRALKVNERSSFQTGAAFTLTASVGIMPAASALFGTLNTLSPIANLLCVPLASLGICSAFAGVGLGLIFLPLAVPFAFLSDIALSVVNLCAECISCIPYSVISLSAVTMPFVLLLLLCEFFISDYFMADKKIKRTCTLLTLFLAAISVIIAVI